MASVTYRELLVKCQPRPIRSSRQHARALAMVEQLMDKPRKTAAEKEMSELLATLIDQYEESIWPRPKPRPATSSNSCWTAQNEPVGTCSQVGIPQSTIANVIAGRRQLSKTNVLSLSKFFRVSPKLFME